MYTLCIYVYTCNVYACARVYNARIQQIDLADQICVAAGLRTNMCMSLLQLMCTMKQAQKGMCVCVGGCGCIHMYIYVHVYIYRYLCICVVIYIGIHTYVHIHI